MDPNAVDDLRSPPSGDESAAGGSEPGDDSETARTTPTSQTGVSAGRVPHGSTDDPHLLDFSANTNPRTPEGVAQVYEAAMSATQSYPSDDYCQFRAAAAEYVGCEATEVIPTRGGLSAIRLAAATTVTAGDEVLVPAPSFGEYAREVRLQGGEPHFLAHDKLLATDPAGFGLVVVCNPNNPTGDAYDPGTLREFADCCLAADTPLLVDEAFLDFTDYPTLAGHEGVMVARSLTKIFGLPGIRAGFAVATGEYRDRLDTARLAWELGTVATCVGTHCLQQEEFVEETRERVASERERMRRRLGTRFDVHPSESPFLLLDCGDSDAVDDLLETVREYDVAVRDARSFRGLDSHVRVAVRLPYENDVLLDALDV